MDSDGSEMARASDATCARLPSRERLVFYRMASYHAAAPRAISHCRHLAAIGECTARPALTLARSLVCAVSRCIDFDFACSVAVSVD